MPAFWVTNTGSGLAAYFVGDTGVDGDLSVMGATSTGAFQLVDAPAEGYVLTSDASGVGSWEPPELQYPYDRTVTIAEPAFNITNTDVGPALRGQGKWGHYGYIGDYQYGVYGESSNGNASGYLGGSSTGVSGTYIADEGETVGKLGHSWRGVYGSASREEDQFGHVGIGVEGKASYGGIGVYGTALGANGLGVKAEALASHGVGVDAEAISDYGIGIKAKGGPGGYAAVFEGPTSTWELEITGGADLSERFEVRGSEAPSTPFPGTVVSIDPDHPGDLAVSAQAYDRKVAGVISGAGGIKSAMTMGQRGSLADGGNAVALTGRVYCLVDAKFGAIQPGDLLTTSDTPGHAMKVSDHVRAQGAIIGKAMTSLPEGRGLVLVLVTLQ
jgi:hypothetical protein